MKIVIRYGAIAFFIAAVAIAAILPSVTSFVEKWSQRDVELRSRLIYNSVHDQVAAQINQPRANTLISTFERLALDERLVALGYCPLNGEVAFATRHMPAAFRCANVQRTSNENFTSLAFNRQPMIAGAFPVTMNGVPTGHLVILHDFGFAQQRVADARRLMLILLGSIALFGAILAAIVALLVMRGWVNSIRQAINTLRDGPDGAIEITDGTPLGHEIRAMLRELSDSNQTLENDQAQWTPDTLRFLLRREQPSPEVIVVSNREPYIHNRGKDGTIKVQKPASGLVSALEPIMRACGGTWIAHGSGSADRETVDAQDHIGVPLEAPNYTLRRIWVSEEEQEGFYYGLANEGLWPLCHIAFVRPVFKESDWQQYRAINQRFADAIVAEAKQPDPIVLIQDYHFALLPKMVREKLPNATIITFWHIPWPNAETFGICPWKEEIIEGLLGSSILGFHTRLYCLNFVETVDRFMESRIDRENLSITYESIETLIRPYPISIAWPPPALAGQASVDICRQAVRQRLNLPENIRLGIGIERFDYTKGILDRMRAVDDFLLNNPEWKERFSFIQVAAPTRSKLKAYQDLQNEALSLANDINERHSSKNYKPIILIAEHHEAEEVFELFRAADLCIVSSLHDGMNLVAKEFVAARDDDQGVLILSSFAGASKELSEALIVNPYDAHGMGQAILRGLQMSETEQRHRMHLMRDLVRARNVYRWAGQMLRDAARLRRRQRILNVVKREKRKAFANAS